MKNRRLLIVTITLLATSITISLIEWIPEVETALSIALFVLLGTGLVLFVTFIIKNHTTLVKSFIIFIVGGAIWYATLFFSILSFGQGFMGPTFSKKIILQDRSFYYYDIGFLDNKQIIKIKHKYLPIMKTIGIPHSNKIHLFAIDDIVYMQYDTTDLAVYDLKNEKKVF
jgi:predicted membrane channel-forming protein YqfA (hemolysin III family)